MKRTKKHTVTIMLAVLVSTLSAFSQKQYKADTEKTTLVWIGEKVTGEHTGYINLKSGMLTMKDHTITSGSFVIDMTTIVCTDIEDEEKKLKLENHLKSEDFFKVDVYPEAYLKVKGSDSFERGSAEVRADLTIRGNTHPITFRATKQDVDEGLRFYANLVIDRTKYDVKYASGKFFDNLVDKTIYDDFMLKIDLLMMEE